ncbi:MAG: hypothetical protein LBK40_07745 [Spirochaetaceae bacterium]|jgi:hypothetical protein|nr:hypothetical protein [Spirochaetaceae bacterium]
MRRSGLCRTVLVLVLLACGAPALFAQGFFGGLVWSFRGSMLVIPEDNGLEGDPMPILGSLGLSAAHPLGERLFFETSLDFYMTHYGFPDNAGRPYPYAEENRSTRVIGSVLGFQALYRQELGSSTWLRAYGGLAADLRLCLIAGGLEGADRDAASKETSRTASYFWSEGRWLFPVIGTGMDFAASQKFLLGFDLRVWFPLYRLWSGESLPAVEGWRFAAGLRFTLR